MIGDGNQCSINHSFKSLNRKFNCVQNQFIDNSSGILFSNQRKLASSNLALPISNSNLLAQFSVF
jgi:hypothetical protein